MRKPYRDLVRNKTQNFQECELLSKSGLYFTPNINGFVYKTTRFSLLGYSVLNYSRFGTSGWKIKTSRNPRKLYVAPWKARSTSGLVVRDGLRVPYCCAMGRRACAVRAAGSAECEALLFVWGEGRWQGPAVRRFSEGARQWSPGLLLFWSPLPRPAGQDPPVARHRFLLGLWALLWAASSFIPESWRALWGKNKTRRKWRRC